MNQEQFLKMILKAFEGYYGAHNFICFANTSYVDAAAILYKDPSMNRSSTYIRFAFEDKDNIEHEQELFFDFAMDTDSIQKVFREAG